MLGDLRILAADGELLLDTERVALQELFNMIRRFSIGYDVELHKRTLERGLLSLIGPERLTVAGVGGLPADEHAHAVLGARDGVGGPGDPDRRRHRPAVRRGRHRRAAVRAATDAGAAAVSEAAAECLRVERGRPRYGIDLDDTRDPAGGGAERARGLVHQGLLRRARRRSRACSTAASPTASCAGCGCRRRADTGDELRFDGPCGRASSRSVVESPRSARSRWRWCAARRRRDRSVTRR